MKDGIHKCKCMQYCSATTRAGVSSRGKDCYLKNREKISPTRNEKNTPRLVCSVWRSSVPESECNELREKRRGKANGTQKWRGKGGSKLYSKRFESGFIYIFFGSYDRGRNLRERASGGDRVRDKVGRLGQVAIRPRPCCPPGPDARHSKIRKMTRNL